METKDYGIIGITLALLISMGVNVMPDDTHYCQDLNLTMQCERLSSTGLTCYPELGTRKGSKFCDSGWDNIITYEEPPQELITKEYTHNCASLDLDMVCVELSSTKRTCYPNEDTREGSKFCDEGWVELSKDKDENNEKLIKEQSGEQFRCDNEKCVRLK